MSKRQLKRKSVKIEEKWFSFDKVKSMLFVFGAAMVLAFFCGALIKLCDNGISGLIEPFTKVGLSQLILACIIAPIGEEIVYRIVPYELLHRTGYFEKLAVPMAFFSSVLFTWIHGFPFAMFMQGALGLLLCWLYMKHRSWKLNMLAHSLWNLFWFIGMYFLND